MSDNNEARRAGVAARREATNASNAEAIARTSGAASTPTPTQEENDLAAVGALDIDAKQDDGSGPDPNAPPPEGPPDTVTGGQQRALGPDAGGGYRTRAVTPAPAPAPAPKPA